MTTLKDLRELEKILSSMLVKQSGLENSRIINALSIRGPELSKLIQETVELSYDLSDTVVIFEINLEENENINFTEKNDTNIREDVYAKVDLTIYGNQSTLLGKQLKARFETEKCRYDLQNQGVILMKVGSITSLNEFINNTVWPRCDLEIYVGCEIECKEIDTFNDFEKINTMTINKED